MGFRMVKKFETAFWIYDDNQQRVGIVKKVKNNLWEASIKGFKHYALENTAQQAFDKLLMRNNH